MFYLATRDPSRVSEQDNKEFKQWKAWELEELPLDGGPVDERFFSGKETRMWFFVLKTTHGQETRWSILEPNGTQHLTISAGNAHSNAHQTQSQDRV